MRCSAPSGSAPSVSWSDSLSLAWMWELLRPGLRPRKTWGKWEGVNLWEVGLMTADKAPGQLFCLPFSHAVVACTKCCVYKSKFIVVLKGNGKSFRVVGHSGLKANTEKLSYITMYIMLYQSISENCPSSACFHPCSQHIPHSCIYERKRWWEVGEYCCFPSFPISSYKCNIGPCQWEGG